MQINLIAPSTRNSSSRPFGLHSHFLITVTGIWLIVIGGYLILSLFNNSAQGKLNTAKAELVKNNEIINKKVQLEELIAQYEAKEQIIKQLDEDKILWSKVFNDLDIIFGINGFSPKDKSPTPVINITRLEVLEGSRDKTFELTIEGTANSFDNLSVIQRNLQGFSVELEDKTQLFKYLDSKIIEGQILEDAKSLVKVLAFKIAVVIPKEVIKK
jgi:hypothetical protein